MNEWASSADTPRLSPAPPAFARTSPSHPALDSGYFGTFADQGVWGDVSTPGAGANGPEHPVFNVALTSPRPIASPGRVANGKGNRWIRPSAVWGEVVEEVQDNIPEVIEDVGTSLQTLYPAGDSTTPSVSNHEQEEINGHHVEATSMDDVSERHQDGLGIVIDDVWTSEGAADEREPSIAVSSLRTVSLSAEEAAAGFVESSSTVADSSVSVNVTSEIGNGNKSASVFPDTYPASRPPRVALVNFTVDLDAVSAIFPPTSASGDLLSLDTIITSSSERKTQYRITRPYSMRQYNVGDFENYKRVNWRDSAIHDKVIGIVGNWIAKDRASGGGMFSVPGNKRSSGFGWGSDDKRDLNGLSASPSSIMLPKITGPTGFGWSTSTMTPLQPSKAGEEALNGAPRASDELPRMQPRTRRTPIRRPRVASAMSLGSPRTPTKKAAPVFDELDMFEKAAPVEVAKQETNHTTSTVAHGHRREVSTTSFDNDFGIFEESTGGEADFQDFSIAPPPALATHPPREVTLASDVHEDYIEADDSRHNQAEPPGPLRFVIDPIASHSAAAPPLPALETSSVLTLNLASPEKEDAAFFKTGDDDFSDFDAFESAPPLEYTDLPKAVLESPEAAQPHKHTDATDMNVEQALPAAALPEPTIDEPPTERIDIEPQITEHTTGVTTSSADANDALDTSEAFRSALPSESTTQTYAMNEQGPDFDQESTRSPQVIAVEAISTAVMEATAPEQAILGLDDFSIFDTPAFPVPAPTTTRSEYSADDIQSAMLTSLTTTNPPAHSSVIADPNTSTLDADNIDEEDDFGAFEEANAPVEPVNTRPTAIAPPSTSTAPIYDFSGLDDDIFFTSEASFPARPSTAPILPPPPMPKTMPTAMARPSSLFASTATELLKLAPKTQVQADLLVPSRTTSSPRKSAFPTSSPQAATKPPRPALSSTPEPLTMKPTGSAQPRNPAKPASPPVSSRPRPSSKTKAPSKKPIDHGASILGALAFLDAEDDAAAGAQEVDFGDWDDEEHREREALASEREVSRLKREEWVGEKYDVGKEAERKEAETRKRAEEMARREEDVVRRIVEALPAWGYML